MYVALIPHPPKMGFGMRTTANLLNFRDKTNYFESFFDGIDNKRGKLIIFPKADAFVKSMITFANK